MSRERAHGLSSYLSRPAAAAVAFLVLFAASALLEAHNPKQGIKARFDARHCCKAVENPYFSTDSAIGFTPSKLYKMLDEYDKDEPGKRLDLDAHRLFIFYDFFYPFFYALPFAVFILCLQRELSWERRVRWLALLPLGAAAFDLVENAGMLLVLNAGANTSNPSDGLVFVSILGNVLKWALVLVSFTLICAGLVGVVLKRAFRVRLAPADSVPN